MSDKRDPFESDREDNAVWERDLDPTSSEQWAEDHGYSRYRCPVHGTFWSDSQDVCPSCEPREEEQEAMTTDEAYLNLMLENWNGRIEKGKQYQPYHNALPAYQQRELNEFCDILKHARENDVFMMRALRNAGILPPVGLP